MFSLVAFAVVFTLLYDAGDAYCTRDQDCVSLSTLGTNRKYCCGGTFCCTYQQNRMGVTTDPFLSMSIGAIVGIVVGVVAFLAICGIMIWYLLKGARKGSLNRKPKARSSVYKSQPSTGLRPGHAVPTSTSRSPDYDYPPDAYEIRKYHQPPAYTRTRDIPYVTSTFESSRDHDRRIRSSRYCYENPIEIDSHR